MEIIALAVVTVLAMGPNDTILSNVVIHGTSSPAACDQWKAKQESYERDKIDMITKRPKIGEFYNCVLMRKSTLDDYAAESFAEIMAKGRPF